MPRDELKNGEVRRKDHNLSVNLTQVIVAMIGAFATIAAAYVAGAFTGKAVGLHATPAVTVTVTKAPVATATGNSAAHSSTVSSSIYWSGPIAFTEGGPGLDFDTSPPSTDQTVILYSGNTLSASANALLSTWTLSGTPSAAQCRTWVSTHPNTNIPFPAGGMQICIKTDQGRYGLLHIASSANNQLPATAVVWNS